MALTKQGFLNRWISAAAGAAMSAAAVVSPLSSAYGQSATDAAHRLDVCSRDTTTEDVLIRAGQHSMCSRDVSVIVSGNADNAAGAQIGAFIEREFAKRGIPAKVFLDDVDEKGGVALTFWLNGLSYGPFGGNNWQDGFAEVETHYPQAWAALSPEAGRS